MGGGRAAPPPRSERLRKEHARALPRRRDPACPRRSLGVRIAHGRRPRHARRIARGSREHRRRAVSGSRDAAGHARHRRRDRVRSRESRSPTRGDARADRRSARGGGARAGHAAAPDAVCMGRAADLDRLGVWRPELAELARLLGAQRMLRDVDEAAALLLERWPRAMRPARERSAPGRVVLGAREVAYRYRGADRDAIAGISLELRRGEIAAIVGANGAGKSTIGLVLARAFRPSRGAVSGEPRVAYVFQYPERGFLANTVREEMTYAARAGGAVARDPDELLERFALARLAEANPHSLSHGEKRRLSVASALVTSPDVLILDEPTFGQDLRN